MIATCSDSSNAKYVTEIPRKNQVSIVFLAMSNTSDLFFEKARFVLDSLGSNVYKSKLWFYLHSGQF